MMCSRVGKREWNQLPRTSIVPVLMCRIHSYRSGYLLTPNAHPDSYQGAIRHGGSEHPQNFLRPRPAINMQSWSLITSPRKMSPFCTTSLPLGNLHAPLSSYCSGAAPVQMTQSVRSSRSDYPDYCQWVHAWGGVSVRGTRSGPKHF